jgi:hypothetical protein
MRRLRQKVEVDPNKPVHVQTVRGVGYRLIPIAGAAQTAAPGDAETESASDPADG